jgi:hypothetical protein
MIAKPKFVTRGEMVPQQDFRAFEISQRDDSAKPTAIKRQDMLWSHPEEVLLERHA